MSSSAEGGGFGAEYIDEALEGASGTGDKASEALEYLRGSIKEGLRTGFSEAGDAVEEYAELLRPDDGEFIEASLERYDQGGSTVNLLEIERGEVDRYRVVSEGRSHRPAVWTDEEPEDSQEVIDIERGDSSTYHIRWES